MSIVSQDYSISSPIRQKPKVLPKSALAGFERAVVWIVDDDEGITAMLGRLMESLGFESRCFHRATHLLSSFDASRAGCLLIDITMPEMTGIELLRRLKERSQPPPTIVISGQGCIPTCVEAMRLGAFDFVQKPFSPAKLKQLVLRAVEADEQRRSGDVHAHQVSSQMAALTEEERATLELILEGRMNKHIAATLDVSRRTVQYRIAGLLEKFGVGSRGQLISVVSSTVAAERN